MRVKAGVIVDFVICTHRSAPAQALITVFAQRCSIVVWSSRAIRIHIGGWFNIVDAATIVIISGSYNDAPALGCSEALAKSGIYFSHITAIFNGRITQFSAKSKCWRFARHLGNQITDPPMPSAS